MSYRSSGALFMSSRAVFRYSGVPFVAEMRHNNGNGFHKQASVISKDVYHSSPLSPKFDQLTEFPHAISQVHLDGQGCILVEKLGHKVVPPQLKIRLRDLQQQEKCLHCQILSAL